MFNHGVAGRVNVKGAAKDERWGAVVATRDILSGEELLCDYDDYCIPLDIRAAIHKRGACDVPTQLKTRFTAIQHSGY